MFELTTVNLGDVTDNYDAKRVPIKTTERIAGRYPYYGASGVIDYVDSYLFDETCMLIAEDGENLRTRSTPIAFMASGQFWVNNHAHVVRGNTRADTRYLCHLLSITDIGGYLTGSTQPKLTRRALDSIRLSLPDTKTQKSVADVLGALDDKIAANTKLAKTADELATNLFRESVRGTPMSDQTFADLASISGGGTPSTKHPEYWGGDVNWATPTDVTGLPGPSLERTSRTISETGLRTCSSSLYPTGSILL